MNTGHVRILSFVVPIVLQEYEKEKEKEDKIRKLDDGSHRAAVAQFMQKVMCIKINYHYSGGVELALNVSDVMY